MVVVERGEALTGDLAGFAEFVQKVFAGRRKQLGAHVRQMGWSLKEGWPEGVSATDRAENLPVERLVALYEGLGVSGVGGPAGGV
jgi:16S rRNA A1518/A1519 N6-dimethyltransferase RsmA/KsgA/DIM1 with predicted DNA glycosylase/AP lyase activity